MTKNNRSIDALLLSGVRLSTILLNIVSSAILSRMVSLEAYGTYSTANLIVSSVAGLTILGMMDAVNFYFHRQTLDRADYINTIGFIQCFVGILCAVVVWMLRGRITNYFSNPMLSVTYSYILFRPLLENLSNSLLTLQISIGKARAVSVQSLLFSIVKLCAVLFTGYISQSITSVLLAYLIMDAVAVFYYYRNFKKAEFAINPFRFKKSLIWPILKYSVPMGVYVMGGVLAKNMDKLVIGYYENTEQLAIYANCSTLLPLGIIASAFLTIIMPDMTRLVQQNKYELAQVLLRDYLSIGFISTTVLAVACIILSDEAIMLLYGEKYLSGKPIFVLYIIVDVLKLANISIILAAKGKTKKLMCISVCMLVINGILNLAFYYWMGISGPAVATVVVTLVASAVLLKESCVILKTSIVKLIDWKKWVRFAVLLVLFTIVSFGLREIMLVMHCGFLSRLLLIGSLFCAGLCLLNLDIVRDLLRSVNKVHSDI